MKDGKILKYEKRSNNPAMDYIDYGPLVLRKEVIDGYPSDEAFDLSTLLFRSVSEGQVSAYEVSTRFYEIGSVQGIKETGNYIRDRIPIN